MMARRKSSIQLPSWFDVKKYDPAESFGLEEWILQFEARREVLFFLLQTDLGLKLFGDTGVGRPYWNIIKGAGGPLVRARHKKHARGSMQSVTPATLKDLYQFELGVFPELRMKAKEIPTLNLFAGKKLPAWTKRQLHLECCDELVGSNVRLIKVDIGFPNTILQDHFREVVKNLRGSIVGGQFPREEMTHDGLVKIVARKENRKNLSKIIEKPNFDTESYGWISGGVLPYIDLAILWHLESQDKITLEKLAEAISRKGMELDADKLRKTTRPLVTKILWQPEYLNALRAAQSKK